MFRHYANCFVLISLFGLHGCDDVPDPSLPNEPPIAMDDSATAKQNERIFIPLLQNDFDIDGDPLLIEITTEAANGTVEILQASVSYTPSLYFTGTDSFVYQITDLVGHTSSAAVSIDVVRRETRAIFSTISGTEEKLYMIDSRDPLTLVDLGQALDPGETISDWKISDDLEVAVLLTDAERIVTVSLDDPTTLANIFEIDATGRTLEQRVILSQLGTRAAYTLDRRIVNEVDLNNVNQFPLYDTGFNPSTMTASFFNSVGNGIVMEGTLGTGDDERSAIYLIPFSSTPVPVLDDPAILQTTFTRPLSGFNSMAWLTRDSTITVPPAAYSCMMPPPQALSALTYTVLGDGDSDNLNMEASNILGDPASTNIISYNNGDFTTGIFVAACPPNTDIVQIIEIPYLAPDTARVLAMADDASDGLWNIDVRIGGDQLIYALDSVTNGLRIRLIDIIGEDDPVVSDLTSAVPDYQTYTAGTELRVPPSTFSKDARRWLFLAPVGGALTRLEWLELASLDDDDQTPAELSTLDLPFTATNLISDGFFAIVQGETAGAGTAPIAMIELRDPQVMMVDVPGELAETLIDPLNQVESPIQLYPIP